MDWLYSWISPPQPEREPSYFSWLFEWAPNLPSSSEKIDLPDLSNINWSELGDNLSDFGYEYRAWLIGGTVLLGISALARHIILNRHTSRETQTPGVGPTPSRTPERKSSANSSNARSSTPPAEPAQPPKVRFCSSLNHALLSISVPKQDLPPPPNVTITFCIDTSGSMNGAREEAVKEGLNTILNTAKRVIDTNPEAKIRIAAIGFDDEVHSILTPTQLSPNTIEATRSPLNNFRSGGGTKILRGLIEATAQVQSMAKDNPTAKHTLILLSDGGDTVYSSSLKQIHSWLSSAKANLFAIGIGENHNKNTMKTIAPSTGSFTGTYIDASTDNGIISRSISSIFDQAIASYTLGLTSAQLPPGAWSVDNVISANNQGFSLGALTKGNINKHVKILTDRLRDRLDLSTVTLDLSYTDYNGRKGTVALPWNPNTQIDPAICHPKSQRPTSSSSSHS